MSDVVEVTLEPREFEWEFARGRTVRGFGYNGQVPGPTIEARVGDTLAVKLQNALPQPTTIHWHGLRVPADMDGTESVQPAVAPDGTFEYRFEVPDAGTFWYHAHVNETEQIERGLYGALIVRGQREPVVDRERVVHVDDLKLDDQGEIAPFGERQEHHEGREGDVWLVNGREGTTFDVAGGHVERWRLVNASNTRYARLALGGRPFTAIASDGGLLPSPQQVNAVLLSPGERVDLAVGPFAEGETIELEALPYDRGRGESARTRLATIDVGRAEPSQAAIPAELRTVEPIAGPDVQPTRTISMKALMHGGGHARAEPVRVGELQVWQLVNETSQDHPFHLHGFFFQVLGEEAGPAWKDTVNVPRQETVRIAWLPDDRPGSWMYHCHSLEHHAMGMMAEFEVVR
jgi:FtsP/CotA-like multicopper oxidase with cupredoxin domain